MRIFLWAALAALILFFAGYAPAADLSVSFIDVGQGDSIFVVSGNSTMLIDTGERVQARKVINFIERYGFSRIDILVGTHPHSDHIGGMADIINRFEIGKILMPRVQHNTRTFENALDAIIKNNLTVRSPAAGEIFKLGAATVTVVGPHKVIDNSLNNYSLVLRLTFDSYSFLFTGDAEHALEADILTSCVNISSTVLKVGHHGSRTSTGAAFLAAVSPEIAVIQVGQGNRYGHPNTVVLNRLKAAGVEIYRTDIHGTVVAVIFGGALSIATEKAAKGP